MFRKQHWYNALKVGYLFLILWMFLIEKLMFSSLVEFNWCCSKVAPVELGKIRKMESNWPHTSDGELFYYFFLYFRGDLIRSLHSNCRTFANLTYTSNFHKVFTKYSLIYCFLCNGVLYFTRNHALSCLMKRVILTFRVYNFVV